MKPVLSVFIATGLASLFILDGSAQQPPPPQPVRTITQVRGDLYKVQSGQGIAAVTVFLVTPEGIILADPLTPEFSTWLKGELATRFPGRPVRYVINSHYHYDHARGGGVFADTAKFVGHANMVKNMGLSIGQARPPGDTEDSNNDGRIDRNEAQTGTRANFDRFDANKDGFLTQQEMLADVRKPDVTFAGDRYIVTLGGKRVELIHAKNRHTDDLVDMYFPAERVLFTGDYIFPKRLCCGFAFDRRPMTTWINSVRALEQLDFDIMVGSHWEQGTKQDVVAFRQFLEDLTAAVSAGIKQGKSLEELQKTIRLEKYSHFGGYNTAEPAQATLPQVIQSAYLSLTKYSN